MTKEMMINRFNELTGHFNGFSLISITKTYAKKMTKNECKKLLELAEQGYKEFRLLDTIGYALDNDYNKIFIYDHRR